MARNKPQETRATRSRTRYVHVSSRKSNKTMGSTNNMITALCIIVASWFVYKGYLETRVNTPFNIQKVRYPILKSYDRLLQIINT